MVEPKLPPSNAKKAEAGYKFTAQGEQSAHEKDVDIDFASPHHTIGKGPTQVAAGDHRHQAGDISGLTVDHGGLTGLDDDDHIAYPTKTGARASGTWPINISGKAATAGAADTAVDATNAVNAQNVDGQSFSWNNPGTWPTYIWVASTNGSAFLLLASKIPQVFVQSATPSGQKTGDIWVTP